MDDKFIETTSEAGQLRYFVYAFSRFVSPQLNNYLVVQGRDRGKTIYRVEGIGNNFVFDPQLSPSGTFVLFKVGHQGSQYPFFRLYVLDTASKNLTSVRSTELQYRNVLWSPDEKRLAYLTGADYGGYPSSSSEPLRLCTCDWKSGDVKLISQNIGLSGGFCWVSPDTIAYTVLEAFNRNGRTVSYPSIYKMVDGRKPQLVSRYGCRPFVSPTGRYIAFFGAKNIKHPAPLSSDWWSAPQGLSLIVSRSNGSHRKFLTLAKDVYPSLCWQGDNSLLSLNQVRSSPRARLLARKWDIASGKSTKVGEINVQDREAVDRPAIDPQFEMLSYSGSNLYVSAANTLGLDTSGPTPSYIVKNLLCRLDTRKGTPNILLKVKDPAGLDCSP